MEVCPAFIDETGVLSGSVAKQPVFGIGALVVPDTREITDVLYRLHFNFISDRMKARNEVRRAVQHRGTSPTLREVDRMMWSTRHHEYKFTEVTRFNLQQYIDILNIYFSLTGSEFHSLIIDRDDPSFELGKWDNDPWVAYANFAKTLLDRRITRDVFAIVDLQGKPDSSPEHMEDILCSAESVKGCLRATSDMSIYLQLVDVLLGCVQFDWKDQRGYYPETSKRAQEKRMLVDFVKGKLGISSEMPFMEEDQSVREWGGQSFTIWKWDW